MGERGEQHSRRHSGGTAPTRRSPRVRARRRQWMVTGLVVLVCAVFMANAMLLGTEADLTPEGRFSLSDATEQLLRSVDEPLEIRFFISDRLRELSDEPERMEQLLKRYDEIGGPRVDVDVIEASGEGAEQAEAAGLRAEQFQEPGDEAVAVRSVYSGFTVNYLDRERVVPFVFGHTQIEYQLSNALWDVLQPSSPGITVMLGTEGEEFRVDYDQLGEELEDRFDITVLERGNTSIPADSDALLLLGSRDLTDGQADAISEYLNEGGNALLAVDGVRVDLQTFDAEPVTDEASEATSRMLSEVGVDVEPHVLLDARSNPLQASGQVSSAGTYPPWVSTDSRSAYPDHPVTRFTSGVDFFWPSPLRIVDPEQGANGPLVVSSSESWIQGEPMNLQPDNRAALTRNRQETSGTYAIAAWSEQAAAEGSRTVVVGDSDFASNLVFYSESLQNFMFMERSLLWIMGQDDVAGLHARSRVPASLDRIEAEFPRLLTARIVEACNTFIVPLVLLLVGFLHGRKRRRLDARAAAG